MKPIYALIAAFGLFALLVVATNFFTPNARAANFSETTDFNYGTNEPDFTMENGANTVSGSLGSTPTDGQDLFEAIIPSTLRVTSVSYSGPAGPHNLVGCGLTGVGNLNQSFSSNNSSCTLSYFINTDFSTSAQSWTVTINTQLVPTPTPDPLTPTPTDTPTPIPPTPTNTPVPPTPTPTPVPPDTEPPSWTVPIDITMLATGLDGAVVHYTATASDNVAVATSGCTPPSGSVFPIGTSEVQCSAMDTSGNTADSFFDIIVEVDSSSIGTLESEIEGLGLPNGVENSLSAPIGQAEALLNDANPNNDGAVCNKLNAFLNTVQQKLAQNKISQAQADALTAFANALKASIGCS